MAHCGRKREASRVIILVLPVLSESPIQSKSLLSEGRKSPRFDDPDFVYKERVMSNTPLGVMPDYLTHNEVISGAVSFCREHTNDG